MGADASKFAVADDLNEEQRHFYERAKLKLAVSLTSAAFGMMLLGFASIAGGNAQFQNYVKEHVAVSNFDVISAFDLAGGWGFSCFVYLLGFFVLTAGALYVSPLLYSLDERMALNQPRRAATRDSITGPNPHFNEIPVQVQSEEASKIEYQPPSPTK